MRPTAPVVMLALLFVVSGLMHFVAPAYFLRIVPSWVPNPTLAVTLSGAAELAGAIGLLVPATRALAGWGLIVLLAAVFPANVYMLQQARVGHASTAWLLGLWLRLPLQPLLMWWVWRSAIRRPAR